MERRAREMAEQLSAALPYPLAYRLTAKTNGEISELVRQANCDGACA